MPVDGKAPPTMHTAAGTDNHQHHSSAGSLAIAPDFRLTMLRPSRYKPPSYLALKYCWSNYIEVVQIAWRRFGSSSVMSFRIRQVGHEDVHFQHVSSDRRREVQRLSTASPPKEGFRRAGKSSRT